MNYIIAVILGYLLGSSNLTYFIAKAKGIDMRSRGSGNLGASNATIVLGWTMGIAVGLHDIGKSALAVILARYLFPDLTYADAIAGTASVIGHIFPFYLRFKGGKGFASYIGMTLGLSWKVALIMAVLVVLVTLISDYIVVGTFSTIGLVPIILGFVTGSVWLAMILYIGSGMILYKHRENIHRLRNKTEIGLRSTAKGEHRVK